MAKKMKKLGAMMGADIDGVQASEGATYDANFHREPIVSVFMTFKAGTVGIDGARTAKDWHAPQSASLTMTPAAARAFAASLLAAAELAK